jgi:hypothetical protein
MQNEHYIFIQRIKDGSGPVIAYYHFNDFTSLKYRYTRCRLAVLGLRMVLVPGSTFTFQENSSLTITLANELRSERITRYFALVYLLSTVELRLLQSQGSTSVRDTVV